MIGIPTLYKGIRFRSRLEAKWACFFDLMKWTWEYEPVDFPGWIPDFSVKGKVPGQRSGNEDVEIDVAHFLVEVKPVEYFEDFDNTADEKKMWTSLHAEGGFMDHNFDFLLLCGTSPRSVWMFWDYMWWGSFGWNEEAESLMSVWAQACNRNQWKAPR